MEPFTMMMGYGLINSVSQLVIRPLTDRLTAGSRREEMMFQLEQKRRLDLDSVRLNKEIELSNNQRIQEYCHQCRLVEAQSQFEKQLEMWALGQFNSSMWPLLTPFDHPSLKPNFEPGQQVPINVFLAKTDPKSPYAMLIQSDVKNRLSNFITTTYSNSHEHPTICRIGDWKDGFQDAAFINALWYGMQGQPSIVINPIQSEFGELLDLNISIWGLASNGYSPITKTVLSGAFGSAIGRIKREETRRWVESGLPLSSPELQHNANLLKQEDVLVAEGKKDLVDCLLVQYKLPKEIQTAVITKFSREYSHIISCIAGMYSDIYHLLEYGSTPYMPQAISEYNLRNGANYEIPAVAAEHYRKALTNLACSNYLQDKLPVVYLNVASSLSYDQTSAAEIFQEGVGLWANRKLEKGREIRLPESIEECVRLLRDNSDGNDKRYLQNAANTLLRINLTDAANELRKRIISLPDVQSSQQSNSSTPQCEWEVREMSAYHLSDFQSWVFQNGNVAIQNGASEAVAYITPDKNLMVAFVSNCGQIIPINNIGGCCIVTTQFYVDSSFIDGNIIEYTLQSNQFVSNRYSFMQKKDFDSFEKLGKQLDTLVNNLKKTSQIGRHQSASTASESAPLSDFEKQIADFFMNCNMVSMESESSDLAQFDKIRAWVVSKLPVKGASKAHILKTRRGTDTLICVFFSDGENVLLDEQFPKKRILCGNGDVELNSFLNGAPIGTINL
ncbi:MAG: hypothetical protein HDS71_08845 [Bacteroidales bacterium]|nr:hypothetical protein [Bacteroidales bacterium]MBD5224131.1 hypothetical protein [Bacteroidales bacterium]